MTIRRIFGTHPTLTTRRLSGIVLKWLGHDGNTHRYGISNWLHSLVNWPLEILNNTQTRKQVSLPNLMLPYTNTRNNISYAKSNVCVQRYWVAETNKSSVCSINDNTHAHWLWSMTLGVKEFMQQVGCKPFSNSSHINRATSSRRILSALSLSPLFTICFYSICISNNIIVCEYFSLKNNTDMAFQGY